jgi:cytochrome c oxidase subunit III
MSVEGNAQAIKAVYRRKSSLNRVGLWLFLISDAFVFGGLLVSRAVLWGDTRPELDQALGLLVTSVLLISSFFMNRAETAIAYGDMKTFFRGTLITLILGVVFLIGVVGVEWPQAAAHGITTDRDVYGAVFYMMTGMHAFHVLTGVIFLAVVLRNARKGLYTPERHWPVEAAAVYWHFVDVVWIFFYPAIYLIGNVVR